LISIGTSIPSFGLTAQVHDVRDPAFSEALAAEQANLNLSLIQPASMLGRVMHGEARPQPSARLFAESVHQCFARMGAQIVQNQMDGIGAVVVFGNPYERNGQEIVHTIDMGKWFDTRAKAASEGQVVQPTFGFTQGGRANNRPGYWSMDKLNFAPRLAVAYSLNARTALGIKRGKTWVTEARLAVRGARGGALVAIEARARHGVPSMHRRCLPGD